MRYSIVTTQVPYQLDFVYLDRGGVLYITTAEVKKILSVNPATDNDPVVCVEKSN